MNKKGAQSKPKSKAKPTNNQDQEPVKIKTKEQKFSLYTLLQLENGPKSTPDEIKKQYKKLAIACHPDKNLGDESAKDKFQKLKEAYDILSDPEKKAIYDETGTVGDDFDENAFQSAYEYYRSVYKKIEKEDIEQFAKQYRNGPMQEQDLLQFYETQKGDMTLLLESIPLSSNEDIPRFISFFEKKMQEKAIKKWQIFEKTKNKVRPLADESEEFEKQKKQKQASFSELALAIRNKSSNMSFLDSLQEKYAPKKNKIEKKKQVNKRQGRNI